ncbi:MFS transporter [Candidatus Francisella endociliophora]|uniref:MFS transporter n=1 Tax=Candidatus Francisella endociliophora TaxID=653937 RepID=A0A097EMU2_9GAMM|nr:sugar porter family MFS transporter [Francisella sp. FSC1006]AIT08873.1 MFS transporter [Francisella sp. FSC1006]
MKEKKINFITVKIAVIAALAGLLFGMDTGYINGSLKFIAQSFHLTESQQGHVASILLVGAAIGALFSGVLSKKFGRRKVLIIAGGIFSLATLVSIFAPNYEVFFIARFVLGVGVGVASFIAPLYLSEISPKEFRGALVGMYQLMITIGIFLVFVTNSALEQTGSWRLMMVALAIPSVLMFVGCLTLPRSPRWLVLVGKNDEAEITLKKIRNSESEAVAEYQEIKETTVLNVNPFSMLKHKYFIKVLFLGMALQVFQQLTGINVFMYYSAQIFEGAGFANPMISTITIGLLNVITTVLAIKYIDRFGRKPILYFGLALVIISCLVVGFIFSTHHVVGQAMNLSETLQWTALAFCLIFVFGFAIAMGPIVWIVCSEIQPAEGRDLGVTASTMSNWVSNAIIVNFSLAFVIHSPGKVFIFFGVASILCLIFVKFFVPETKDVSLEQIENNLRAGKPLAKIGS